MKSRFRWVACKIEELRYCYDRRTLRYALEDRRLLQTLSDTYGRILAKISEHDMQDATSILRLLAWSQRPLRLEEFADAIAVDLNAKPAFDPQNRSLHPQDILQACQGLVSLSTAAESTDSGYSERNRQLRFTHFSVKQYLLSDRIESRFRLGMDRSLGNAQVAKICLAYLASVTAHSLSLEDIRSQYPFAQYSAEHWSDHARAADAADYVLWGLVASFLDSGNAAFGTCYRLFDPERPQSDTDDDRVTQLPDPLYIASLLGLDRVVHRLIQNGPDINAKRGLYGNPLQAASFAGYHSTVQIILDAGADVNAQDDEYGTALHMASLKGFDKVVLLLVDHGADVNASGGNYITALQAASSNGHHKVVQILLDKGADVNALGGKYGNALQAASANGHDSILKILLDCGADVNTQVEYSGTVLYRASQEGLDQIAQTLIKYGAEVDVQGGEYGTALQVAVHEGHLGVVQLLLDRGANINAHYGTHGTALQIASEGGHESIVRILLGRGAEIMTASPPGSMLLHAVARKGLTQILELLLGIVASIEMTDSAGCSLINIAAQKGHLDVTRLLLERGADVSISDIEGWTPLNRAADGGYFEVVKLLIEHDADLETRNNVGHTPIYSAAEKGHIEIIGILLDSGAKVSNEGWGASHRGRDEIMRVQLARASRYQEGHSNVAYSEFHDSGYSSRQTRPMVDDHKGADLQPVDDDIQSVGTVEADIQSTTESLTFSNIREAAADEIAKAFIGDDEISMLYDEGLKRMNDSKFIDNHRRLLKLFYLEAAKDAKDASDHVVLRFLRSRIARVRVSARIIKAKDPLDEGFEMDIDRGPFLRLLNEILTPADKIRDTSQWTERQ